MGVHEKRLEIFTAISGLSADSELDKILAVVRNATHAVAFDQKKGLRVSEYSYVYLVHDKYLYARVNLRDLIPGIQLTDEHSGYFRKSLGTFDIEKAKILVGNRPNQNPANIRTFKCGKTKFECPQWHTVCQLRPNC